jgi:beta-phosphoglucomutase-like phosphatase (HAD superfamily)
MGQKNKIPSMEALIFDMDGLMIDSERLYFETEREMARSFGREVSDHTLRKMMGRSPCDSLKIFADDLSLTLSPQELVAIRNERMAARLSSDCLPLVGLNEIIDTFSGKLKMAVATGSPPRLLQIVLKKLSLANRFDAVVTSEDVVHGKPDPAIYLSAAGQLSRQPEQCIVLEDSENGARAGFLAGCHVIAIPTEYTDSGDFSFIHYRARDLLDARDYIMALIN